MTIEPAPAEMERDVLPIGTRRFADSHVRLVASWLDRSALLDEIATWKNQTRRGRGGRPETFPLRAVLVSMLLAAISNQPMLASTFTEIMYLQLSATMRAELGIPKPTTPYPAGSVGAQTREHLALYRNVRTRLHGLLILMDPSPLPKNRRLAKDQFAVAVARRERALCNDDLARRFDRLQWFVNELLEMSIRLLPREVRRRWSGSVAVDATAVRAYARPSRPRHGKRRWNKKAEIEMFSADPDAGMYIRNTSGADGEEPSSTAKKSSWAYEASLVVAGSDQPGSTSVFPNIVVGMAPLHKPGREPGLNATRALNSIHLRDHPAGWLAGDRAYTDAKPENFALPARALGYRTVLDYAGDHFGVQGQHQGFLFIEGAWYCPAMPEPLVNATIDFNKGVIDEPTYGKRLQERWRYGALSKSTEDDEGYRRLRCPAASPSPTAACPLKPASQQHDKRVRLTVLPSQSLQGSPPSCCTQGSVTVGPEPMAKLRQDLYFQSEEWSSRYHALRSTIEGMNGYLKDGAREALDDPERRRIRGVAAQSVFVALLVFAGNFRKIQSFMKSISGKQGVFRRRPRRRLGTPISAWLPEADAADAPDPPADPQ